MDLKPWQLQFIQEYLLNGNNATQAYLKVKPNVENTTARTEGSLLLAKPNVKQEMDRVLEERLHVTADTSKITQDKLNLDTQRFINMALVDRNPNAGLKGVELQGRMNGLLDKRERESAGWQTLIQSLTINNVNELPEKPTQVIDLIEE